MVSQLTCGMDNTSLDEVRLVSHQHYRLLPLVQLGHLVQGVLRRREGALVSNREYYHEPHRLVLRDESLQLNIDN